MTIKLLNVSHAMVDNSTRQKPNTFSLSPKLNKDDTYMVIFSYYQQHHLKTFENFSDVNIIFKSKPCRNHVGGHGDSKNTVIVFELKDSYGTSPTV